MTGTGRNLASPPDLGTDSWCCPSGMRNSDRVSSWLAVRAESSAGLTTSLVEEEGGAAPAVAVEVTGIWQNLPVKVGGQRQRSDCKQMPPFLHSRGQRTTEGGATQHQSAGFVLKTIVLKHNWWNLYIRLQLNSEMLDWLLYWLLWDTSVCLEHLSNNKMLCLIKFLNTIKHC